MANLTRVQRVADEIKKQLELTLRYKMRDPRLAWVSITDVEVSRDLAYADVFFSMFESEDSPEQVRKALAGSQGFFKKYLASQLNLRIVPQLRFFYDNSMQKGYEMDQLIAQARQADAALIQSDETDKTDSQTNTQTNEQAISGDPDKQQLR